VEPSTRGFLEFVAGVSGSDYITAIEELHHVVRAAAPWWESYDLLLTPTIPMPPLPLGSFDCPPDNPFHAMAQAMMVIPFVVPFNITGQPAISLPLHTTESGLPVGIQLAAEYACEDLLIRVASQLEEAAPWADRRPALS
jgi:amidase